MTSFSGTADVRRAAGTDLGVGDWVSIGQDRIDRFADATDDHQWIHVDVERAEHGPFGTTIAHGFLTLSLVNTLIGHVFDVRDVSMSVNYGLNKVRFPAPVPAGSRIRAAVSVGEVTDVPGGVQVVLDATIEIEGAAKPACVAQVVHRHYE